MQKSHLKFGYADTLEEPMIVDGTTMSCELDGPTIELPEHDETALELEACLMGSANKIDIETI